MNGKKRRGERAPPSRACETAEGKKQQGGRGGLEQDVVQVKPARLQTRHLAVKHEGQRRQRVPLAHMAVGKRPPDARGSQTRLHRGNLLNVLVVVKTQEPELPSLTKNHDHQKGDSEGDPELRAGKCQCGGSGRDIHLRRGLPVALGGFGAPLAGLRVTRGGRVGLTRNIHAFSGVGCLT